MTETWNRKDHTASFSTYVAASQFADRLVDAGVGTVTVRRYDGDHNGIHTTFWMVEELDTDLRWWLV